MSRNYLRHEDSADIVAGYHTGLRAFVDADYIKHGAVHLHESIHDRIFTETADGRFHLMLLMKARSSREPTEAQAAADISERLFDSTRIAHERAATYLGVKALSDDEARNQEVATLTSEYACYYRFFSALLEPYLQSSFVQFSLAWGATCWAFGASRFQTIESNQWHDWEVLNAIRGPTERLDQLVTSVTKKRGY
jgi:hypothetical protein